MNRNYVFCTQEPWGHEVFARLTAPQDPPVDERWTLLQDAEGLGRLTARATPRYLFFVHWHERVPQHVLDLGECVNVHCTALPYGRGGSPIENLLLRGHTETLLTAHRMTAEIDAGPIYGTRGPVSLAGTRAEILQRFVEPTEALLRWIVAAEPVPIPQEGAVVRFTRLRNPEAFWALKSDERSRDVH